jgi:hypothetical protein
VAAVQNLLSFLPEGTGRLATAQDGSWIDARIGPRSIETIGDFQQAQFRLQDSLVEPSDFTKQRLNTLIDESAEALYEVLNPFTLKQLVLRRARILDPTLVDLGSLIGAEHMLACGGMVATYENGIIVHHPALDAFDMHGPTLDGYRRWGEDVLGYPISDERAWLPGNGRV